MKKTLFIFITLLLLFACAPPAPKTSLKNRNIYYTGAESGVKTALLQAGYTLVDDFEKADVLVLNGEIPDVNALAARLQHGAGLVIISGPDMSFRDVEVLIDRPVDGLLGSENPNPTGLSVEESNKNDPFITEINWNDAPPIYDRAFISNPGPAIIFLRVNGYAAPVFGTIGHLSERKFFISAFLDEQHNLQFQKWKYFNYMIYHLVERAAGAEPMTSVDYSATFSLNWHTD